MQNWDIVLHEDVCTDEDAHAETWQNENAFVLNVRISKDFFNRPPEGVQNTVVHELTHAQHRDVNILWDSCTAGNTDVPASQAKSWDYDFKMFMERFVDWVANSISPTVPLWDPKKPVPTTLGTGLHLFDRPN